MACAKMSKGFTKRLVEIVGTASNLLPHLGTVLDKNDGKPWYKSLATAFRLDVVVE